MHLLNTMSEHLHLHAQGGMAWDSEAALLPGPGSYEHLDAFHPLYAGVCVCAGERAGGRVCERETERQRERERERANQ